jgi:predicted Zn-dependent protease
LNLSYSIIGVFLNLNENIKNPNFELFINSLSNITDLEPFYELYNFIMGLADDNIKSCLNVYKSTLELIENKRTTKRKRFMNVIYILYRMKNGKRLIIMRQYV